MQGKKKKTADNTFTLVNSNTGSKLYFLRTEAVKWQVLSSGPKDHWAPASSVESPFASTLQVGTLGSWQLGGAPLLPACGAPALASRGRLCCGHLGDQRSGFLFPSAFARWAARGWKQTETCLSVSWWLKMGCWRVKCESTCWPERRVHCAPHHPWVCTCVRACVLSCVPLFGTPKAKITGVGCHFLL